METQKRKAVRTNVHISFVQVIEKAVVIFCVNSRKAMKKREERGASSVDCAAVCVAWTGARC